MPCANVDRLMPAVTIILALELSVANSQRAVTGTGRAAILRHQFAWAKESGVPMDAYYGLEPERNLPWLTADH